MSIDPVEEIARDGVPGVEVCAGFLSPHELWEAVLTVIARGDAANPMKMAEVALRGAS